MTAATGKKRPEKKAATAERKKDRIDPRIRARRIEVQRTEGRRRLRTVVALFCITAVAVGSLVLIQSSWLDVDRLAVNGAVKTDPREALDATGINLGDPLVDLDLDAATTPVERLPWVETATIERRWNGDLTLVITEREPLLALPSPTGYVLVDRSGRQLEVVPERPFGFMPVAGVTASGLPGDPAPASAQSVIRLLGEVRPEVELEISQVVVDGRTLYLDLKQGGRVRLGSDSGLEEKLVSLETILARVDLRCLWEIDIRVASAPAVTRVNALGEPGVALTDLSECS